METCGTFKSFGYIYIDELIDLFFLCFCSSSFLFSPSFNGGSDILEFGLYSRGIYMGLA